MTKDEWYEDLERRYAKSGYTREDFIRLTLESALKNDEGICWPPSTSNWLGRASLLIGMWRDMLIVRKNFGYHTPMEPYLITDKGREALQRMSDTQKQSDIMPVENQPRSITGKE